MAGVQLGNRVDVKALLQTDVAPQESLGKNIWLVDSDEIPVDRRVFEVTRTDFADSLDSSGLPYAYAQTHFSQKRTPDSLLIGRWAKTATETYTVMGSAWEQDYTDWKAITDGTFQVFEVATPATLDEITAVDFSGITALSQVPTVLNAKLAALVAPNVAGLDTALFSFDVFGRLILTMPNTGASAATVNVAPVSPPAGTDLAVLFDYTNTTPVAGLDAETIVDAVDATEAKDSSGFFITAKLDNVKATKNAEITALCAKVQTMNKFGIVLSDDPLILDSADTTNIFYQMSTLGYNRSAGIYYENIADRETVFPDAAGLGAVMPALEGTTKFCQEALAAVGVSGYIDALTNAETEAVLGHGGNVVERVEGFTYWFEGLAFSGEEIRIMMGRDWFTNGIALDVFNYKMQQPLAAFDNETLTAYTGFIRNRGEEAITRRIGVDTVERPFTINMPDEDAFTQAERASHDMELLNVFTLYLNSAANRTKIEGIWTL